MKKNSVKLEKLTDHFTYRIINDTIYLFQSNINVTEDELMIVCKKLSLIIEDNDIYYINISAERMEDRKEIYQNIGFSLSYYDTNKLNLLYDGKKNKNLYKCYGIMTRSDFLRYINSKNNDNVINNRKIVSSNDGFVYNMLLLFGGVILLCYFCVNAAIYIVK